MSREIAKVCRYDEHLAEAFDRFCRVIWPRSRGTVAAPKTASSIAPPPPTFVFLKGDAVVGHVTTIPVRLAHAGRIAAAHWIVGFMVLPDHRNGLVGPLLIKEVNRALDCALSLHVEPPVLRILTGLRWLHRGVVPQYLRILNAGEVAGQLQFSGLQSIKIRTGPWVSLAPSRAMERLVRRLGGGVLATGQALWSAATVGLRGKRVVGEIVEEESFDQGYDELWDTVGMHFGAVVVRDRMYLHERFGCDRDRYRVLACRAGRRLLGYCVLTQKTFSHDPRMGDMKIGTVVDCLCHPDDSATLQALIEAACCMFRSEGMHAVLCTASHRSVRSALIARGFFGIPGNLHFAYHAKGVPSLTDVPLGEWHVMRGDSDADQNF